MCHVHTLCGGNKLSPTSPKATRINSWMCSFGQTGGCGPALTSWSDCYVGSVSLQLIPPVIFLRVVRRSCNVLRCHSWLRLSDRNLNPLHSEALQPPQSAHEFELIDSACLLISGLTVKNNQRMAIPHCHGLWWRPDCGCTVLPAAPNIYFRPCIFMLVW